MMTWREYQAKQRILSLEDEFVSYIDEGNGDPFILLHGIPTWGYLWHGVYPRLVDAHHRVFIPDLIGFGFSSKNDWFDRSIDRQTTMVTDFMDEVGIDRATIIGHDIGGGVALRLATLYPERVTALCVMNTVCYDSWPIEAMMQLGNPAIYRKMSAATMHTMIRSAIREGFSSSHPDELIDGLLAPYRTEVGKLSLIRNAAALNTNLTTELTPLLPTVRIPTLIVWGEEDKFQKVWYAKRLQKDIDGSTLFRVRDAGHFVMLDQPDEVMQQLTTFLEGVRAEDIGPIRQRAE